MTESTATRTPIIQTTPTYIYKILPIQPPTPLPPTLPLSPLDATDGFIHLSTAAQVSRTAARFFSGHESLWILKLRVDTFGPGRRNGRIVWEDVPGVGVFPHLFGAGIGDRVVEEVLIVTRSGEGAQWVEDDFAMLE